MFHQKSIRERLMSGESCLGCFVNLYCPGVVEILGRGGFEFAVLDNEHGIFTQSELENMVRAGECAGMESIVRVDYNPSSIQKALDMGASGVLVPMIRTAEDVRQAVRRAKYPPEGTRGTDFTGRAFRKYRKDERGFLRAQNEDTMVIVQIETKEAVDHLDEILREGGVSAVFLGAMDLSVALGEESPATPRMQSLLSDIARRAGEAGVPTGAVFLDPAMRSGLKDMGVQLMINTVLSCLSNGIEQALREE